MGLRLGMDIPGWPPENIEEMAKKLEQEFWLRSVRGTDLSNSLLG